MRYWITLSLLSGILVLTVAAQDFGGSVTSFGGGVALSSKTGEETGFNLFFNYGKLLSHNAGLRGDLMYHNVSVSSHRRDSSWVPIVGRQVTETRLNGNVYGVTAKIEGIFGQFDSPSNFLYYGIFGIGIDLSGSSTTITTKVNGKDTSRSDGGGPDFNPAFGFGAGGGYRTSSKFALLSEVKYNLIDGDGHTLIRFGFTWVPAIRE